MFKKSEVYFCIVHNHEVYTANGHAADHKKCLELLRKYVAGKRKDVLFVYGKAEVIQANWETVRIENVRVIASTEKQLFTQEIHKGWVTLGAKVRKAGIFDNVVNADVMY